MKTGKLAVVSGAMALSIGTVVVHGAENPFALRILDQGYQIADADTKMKEGQCSSGKCGVDMKKMKEGSCSADKMKDGSCHHDKAKQGSCSAEKMKEGSCHASK